MVIWVAKPRPADVDGEVALLLSADPDAAVARDAVVVVAEDERVLVVLAAACPDFLPGKARAVGTVALGELPELLRGIAAQRIDGAVLVFRDHQLDERLAELLDLRRGSPHHHARARLGGAGSDRRPHAFNLDHAKSAAAEGLEPLVVAESGNLLAVACGHLVDGFAFSEADFLAVEGHPQVVLGLRCDHGWQGSGGGFGLRARAGGQSAAVGIRSIQKAFDLVGEVALQRLGDVGCRHAEAAGAGGLHGGADVPDFFVPGSRVT